MTLATAADCRRLSRQSRLCANLFRARGHALLRARVQLKLSRQSATVPDSSADEGIPPARSAMLAQSTVPVYPVVMADVTPSLRTALEKCGQTRYAVSKATGIPESTLSR